MDFDSDAPLALISTFSFPFHLTPVRMASQPLFLEAKKSKYQVYSIMVVLALMLTLKLYVLSFSLSEIFVCHL